MEIHGVSESTELISDDHRDLENTVVNGDEESDWTSLQAELKDLRKQISDIIEQSIGEANVFDQVGLLQRFSGYSETVGGSTAKLASGTVLEFEKMLHTLTCRNQKMLALNSMPLDKLRESADTLHEMVVASDVIDFHWLSEMTLRCRLSMLVCEHGVNRNKWEALIDKIDALVKEDTVQMLRQKELLDEMFATSQSISKIKVKLQELEHHCTSYKNACSLLRPSPTVGSETLRCSVYDLTRINGSYRDKLAIANSAKEVYKAKIISHWTSFNAKFFRSKRVPLQHFSSLVSPYINSAGSSSSQADWSLFNISGLPVSVSVVSSTPDVFAPIMQSVISSMGNFGEEIVHEFLLERPKRGDDVKRYILTESEKFRLIGETVRWSLEDALIFLDESADCMQQLPKTVLERLKCKMVVYWKEGAGGVISVHMIESGGVTAAAVSTVVEQSSHDSSSGPEYLPAYFLQNESRSSVAVSELPEGLQRELTAPDCDNEELALFDIVSIVSEETTCRRGELSDESRNNFKRHGMVLYRSNNEVPLTPFVRLYGERILNQVSKRFADTQLQLIQSQERTLQLRVCECMLALRKSGNNITELYELCCAHFDFMFSGKQLEFFIAVDGNADVLLRLGSSELTTGALKVDISIEKLILQDLFDDGDETQVESISWGKLLSVTYVPESILPVIRSGQGTTNLIDNPGSTTNVIPVGNGRNIVMVVRWTNDELREENNGVTSSHFSLASEYHLRVFNSYMQLVQSLLAKLFHRVNTNISSLILDSYDNFDTTLANEVHSAIGV